MKKIRLYAWFIVLSLLIAACSSGTIQPKDPNSRWTPYPEESQILGLANAFRTQAQTCGTQQLPAAPAFGPWVEAVGDAAWLHSVDMGAQNSENHVGASTVDRLKARNFNPGLTVEHRKRTALPPGNAADAFEAWKADSAACADLMNPNFTVLGAGLWGKYEGGTAAFWTMILTTPQGNAQPSLTLSPTTSTVTVGGAGVAFTATLLNSTDTINWAITTGGGTLSNTTGATTTYTPPATGGAGTATLTATAGTLTASATITINAAALPTLTLSPTTSTVTVGGAGVAFSATLTNSTDTINWTLTGAGSISNATGATTTYTPPATGGAGTATLSATAGALTANATITINAAAPGLTITPATASVAVGSAPIQFKASSNQVTWSITGLFGGWGAVGETFTYTPPAAGTGGTATITATLGTLTASATVTITSLNLTPATAIVTIGGPAVDFSATLTNSTETINWSLTGSGSISSTTGATTSYTPPATGTAGTATLTATAGALTASATITIEPPFEETFLALINAFRAQPQVCKNGTVDENMPAVPSVSLHALLNQAAQGHSQDMATNNFFSHTGSNGSSFSQRIAATGYPGTPGGENIAAGSDRAQGAFDSWRASTAGHCQGMMNATINEIGIGYARNAASQWTHYWTLVTGNRTP